MLCSRSASLMTSTRMSRAIATTILRTVSASRRLAVLDLVQLGHTVDERGHLVAEVGAQRLDGEVGVLDRVVQQRGGERRAASCPRSARIWATASGCVMYGSPLLRRCPRWRCSATSYARSTSRRSALGWLALTTRNSGSRTAQRLRATGGRQPGEPPTRRGPAAPAAGRARGRRAAGRARPRPWTRVACPRPRGLPARSSPLLACRRTKSRHRHRRAIPGAGRSDHAQGGDVQVGDPARGRTGS